MFKIKSFALILGVFIMSFLIGYLVFAAWQEPNTAPPGGNVSAPVNVGQNEQWKEGGLAVGAEGITPFDVTGSITAPIFYDANDHNNRYVDPSGISVFSQIFTPYLQSYSPWPANEPKWRSDINKDGVVDTIDLSIVVPAIGCSSGNSCWDAPIGVDNLGNYIYGRDADVYNSGSSAGKIDLQDLTALVYNYDKYYHLTVDHFSGFSAASFEGLVEITNGNLTITGGDVVVTDGYLTITKTFAGAPTPGDCTASTLGRFAIDTTNNRLYICMGAAGWKYATLLNP